MAIQAKQLAWALASATLLTLAGCGGGGDGGSTGSTGSGGSGGGTGGGTDTGPVVSKTSVPVTVVDGALQNALVCLDTSLNGRCDADEPSGRTDAAGRVVLQVPDADVGKYPIVASVGLDAIDADHGEVKTAYTLKAPADRTGVVSPLTTLVQSYVETSGGTSADAGLALQAQLGLDASVFDDFTQDTSDAGKLAGTLARLIVVVTQTQLAATQGATGADNQPLPQAQIDNAIHASLLAQLPTLALKVRDDPTLGDPGISVAQKQVQIEAAAQQVAAAAGLTKDSIASVVAEQSQAPGAGPADESGVATVSLRWLSFTNLQNYFLRAFEATAAQNTPDANGKTHFTEVRERQTNGFLEEWGMGANNWTRPQIYWTGSEWFDCPTGFEHESTPVNAAGESESLYCKAVASRSKRSNVDISGRAMIDVVREIRAYPGADAAGGAFASWGPNPDLPAIQSALGTAVFPAGSVLSRRTVTDVGGAIYYNRTPPARIPSAAQPDNPDFATWRNATLDEFIGWNTGNYVNTVEVHGNNSHVLLNRDYTRLDGAAGYKRYLVAFQPGTANARFFQCEGNMQTRQETPPRNSTLFVDGKSTCAPILETTYRIETLGGRRVLSFTAEPAQLSDFGAQAYRLFIERQGVTFSGFRDKPQVSKQQRLNGPAAEALLAKLGLD